MAILGVIIYGATHQQASSTISVTYSRPSYAVTFDPMGGGVSPSQKTVKLGDNYGDLPVPTKTGYTFLGWKTSSGNVVASTTQNTIVGNHTLTADWTPTQYTVTTNLNGGTLNGKSGNATNTIYTEESMAFDIPTRTGYTFAGWSFSGGTVNSGASYNAFGKALNSNPAFNGTSSVWVYNNKGNGTVTHSVVQGFAPNNTGYYLEITTAGEASPGLGGYTHYTNSYASAVFTTVIIAKIPVGYSIAWASNAYGGGSSSWLTSQAGTGTWQRYIYKVTCGSNGSYSSTNFYYLTGTAATAEKPVKWQVAYSQVFDSTGASSNALNTAQILTCSGGVNITATANWNINYYASDLNIYNPSGTQDMASGTCNITYTKDGQTYASGTDLTNENWDCSAALFPYETIITVSNIKSLGEWDITRVVIGGQTITGSNGVYTAKMTGSANVELYTTYWPDLPSSAGATFVNTQALQDSSGGRGKRVVQINTTKNASGTARTYKYSWDGSNWSNGASLVEKTSQGDQTLYVRVYPTGGEHYRGYVQTSTVVHLNKLPNAYLTKTVRTGWGGWWGLNIYRKVNTATLVCWATGDNVHVGSATDYNDDSAKNVAGWNGWLISVTSSTTGYAYHKKNGFIDSDTVSITVNNNDDGSAGNGTTYTTTDDGQLTT